MWQIWLLVVSGLCTWHFSFGQATWKLLFLVSWARRSWSIQGEKERLATSDRLLWMLQEGWRYQSDCRTFSNCIYLPYWSHDQYFSNNKNRLASYMSLTVASEQHKETPLFLTDHYHRTALQTLQLWSFFVTFVMMSHFWIPPCHVNLYIGTKCSFSVNIWPVSLGLTLVSIKLNAS